MLNFMSYFIIIILLIILFKLVFSKTKIERLFFFNLTAILTNMLLIIYAIILDEIFIIDIVIACAVTGFLVSVLLIKFAK